MPLRGPQAWRSSLRGCFCVGATRLWRTARRHWCLHRQGTPDPARAVRQGGCQWWRGPVGGSPAGDRRHEVGRAESVNVRQQSATRKTKVSGKKQALDSTKKKKKKAELVNRGRHSARMHVKQTKLDFEQRTRDATPKRTRSDTEDSPGSTSLTGKHARLTDSSETGGTTQTSTSQPTWVTLALCSVCFLCHRLLLLSTDFKILIYLRRTLLTFDQAENTY